MKLVDRLRDEDKLPLKIDKKYLERQGRELIPAG
jgi:hypothetical protein